MTDVHVEALARVLAAGESRRVLTRVMASLTFGGFFTRAGMVGAKRKKGKRKRKPLALNEFGCVNVGGVCRGKNRVCCSGHCQGKKPKPGQRDRRRCVAHDTGS